MFQFDCTSNLKPLYFNKHTPRRSFIISALAEFFHKPNVGIDHRGRKEGAEKILADLSDNFGSL